ncbi:TscA family type II toxin-antitoxin system antitoxin [Staphylococcus aureus]|uniref:TscA family type II toxin-antitoxin system antitoxin n=1 Tax=Staphylococcus aureus TaxID=1280 RepID=UPI0008521271|nr:pathogenicity island protein [Staphylococcus aureus]
MNTEQKDLSQHLASQLLLCVLINFESYDHTEYVNSIEVVSDISREKYFVLLMIWCGQEI